MRLTPTLVACLCPCVPSTGSGLLGLPAPQAMVLDAPASLQVVSLEEGHVATTDRVVVGARDAGRSMFFVGTGMRAQGDAFRSPFL